MKKLATLSAVLVFSLFACTSDDSSSVTGGNGGNQETNGNQDTIGNGGGNGAPSAGMLQASGSLNGSAFTMACDLANCSLTGDGDPCQRLCQSSQWMVQCRDQLVDGIRLYLYLPAEMGGQEGEHDFLPITAFGNGIELYDGDNIFDVLRHASENATENKIVVTQTAAAQGNVAGSFSAAWANDGGSHGSVSGTFDIPCAD